jgi:O-antigen/teichoic acid export membrane protein
VSNRLEAFYRFLVGTGGSMSGQIARGGVWVFAAYGLVQVLSLVRSVILARLLTPADFGLMGMASLSLALLAVFTDTGIWPVLIQRSELDQPTLNTAWLISAARGIVLGFVTLAAAPWVGRFFEAPLLVPMLRVMALSFVLAGFNSLGLILLQKQLDFRTLAAVNLATSVVNLVAATVAAFLLRSVWALVIGTLTGSLAALLLSYLVHPFRPQWRFDRGRARGLFGFGKFLTASTIVNYVLTQGDDAYVGKVLGSEALGFYGLAYRLSNLPATSISHVLNQVTLPAYSAMQHDLDRLRLTYLRILKLTALVVFPMAAGLFGLAPFVVGVLYGEKWLPMVPAFQILCLFGLERAIGSVSAPIFLALGKPDIGLRVSLVKLVTMVLCIVPLTAQYGIVGTSIAVTLSAIAVQSAVIPVVTNLLKISWFEVVKPLLKPLGGSLLMLSALLIVERTLALPTDIWQLVGLVAFGMLVYGGFVGIAERQLIRDLKARLGTLSVPNQISETIE